jgi:hypothetical protein
MQESKIFHPTDRDILDRCIDRIATESFWQGSTKESWRERKRLEKSPSSGNELIDSKPGLKQEKRESDWQIVTWHKWLLYYDVRWEIEQIHSN